MNQNFFHGFSKWSSKFLLQDVGTWVISPYIGGALESAILATSPKKQQCTCMDWLEDFSLPRKEKELLKKDKEN